MDDVGFSREVFSRIAASGSKSVFFRLPEKALSVSLKRAYPVEIDGGGKRTSTIKVCFKVSTGYHNI